MNFTFGHHESNPETALKTLTGERRLFELVLTENFVDGLGCFWNNVVKWTHENTEEATRRFCHAVLPSDKWNTPWLDEKG